MKKTDEILQEVNKVMIGKAEEIRKVMMVVLAKGHILLEDIPGVGKTTLATAFAKAMQLDSKRLQFTVDVLPSDVVGYSVIDPTSGEVRLHKGAVFCNIFLADEINRTSSKTQAALLEVMEEKRITIDGYTQIAPQPFMVIATQNPYGSAGTQLLPESQLDRFMIRMSIGYPSAADEVEMLKRKQIKERYQVQPVASKDDVLAMQKECEEIFVHDDVYRYIVDLVSATRHHERIYQGASPRASIALSAMAKANAYLHDRDYIVPEDVQYVFHDVIAHRILMKNDIVKDYHTTAAVLQNILEEVEKPQLRIA